MTLEIEFEECVDSGDLDRFKADLKNSGAEVLDSSMHQEDESALIYIQMKSRDDFMDKFRQTNSYEFANVY